MAAITSRPVGTRYMRPGNWAAGYHTGVDFLTPVGDRLVAPVDSKIIHAGTGGWGSAYGVQVIGEGKGSDGKTYRWITAHMSRTSVRAGQRVKAGGVLGQSGNTGNTTGPHVHFEVRARSGVRRRAGYRHYDYDYWQHVNPEVVLSAQTLKPDTTTAGTAIAPTKYRVAVTALNARGGPGTDYVIKATHGPSKEFTATRRSGDWVMSDGGWWRHSAYLEEVKPPSRARVRLGSLNIPLDAAKLPDGEARAKIAARQVHESNLHVVAMQELDRGYPGDTWYYARLILTALRELDREWRIVKPTTALNENVMFYRPSKAKLKRRLDDLILTSSAGGRHASRATFDVDGRTLAVRNTHLVSGAKNGAAREHQAKQISEYVGRSTVIIGDLNQKALPKAFEPTHKTSRDHARATTNAKWGTYSKWGNLSASGTDGAFLDHIVVPKESTVYGYTVVGLEPDGTLDQPRASDHLLIIVSIDI